MTSYDWEKEKLSDQDLATYFKDIDFCSTLKSETLTCVVCGLRLKQVDLSKLDPFNTSYSAVSFVTTPTQTQLNST